MPLLKRLYGETVVEWLSNSNLQNIGGNYVSMPKSYVIFERWVSSYSTKRFKVKRLVIFDAS